MEQITTGIPTRLTVNYAIRGITNPQKAGAVLQGPTFILPTPVTLPTGQGPLRIVGDYASLAIRPNTNTPLYAPGCGPFANDFFPLYTANDGTGPTIVTRGFTLTPP